MSRWSQAAVSGKYSRTPLEKTLKTEKTSMDRELIGLFRFFSAEERKKTNWQAVRNFIDLVVATAVFDYQVLIDDERIIAELDAADLQRLPGLTREERQAWAQQLAQLLGERRLQEGPPRRRQR